MVVTPDPFTKLAPRRVLEARSGYEQRYEQTLNNSTRSTIRLGRVDRLIGMCTFVTYASKRLSGAKRWPAVREVRL